MQVRTSSKLVSSADHRRRLMGALSSYLVAATVRAGIR